MPVRPISKRRHRALRPGAEGSSPGRPGGSRDYRPRPRPQRREQRPPVERTRIASIHCREFVVRVFRWEENTQSGGDKQTTPRCGGVGFLRHSSPTRHADMLQVSILSRSHAPRGDGIFGRSAAGVSVAASFSLRVFDRGAVPWREKDRSLKAAATKSKAFLVPTLRVGTEYLAALRPSKLHRLSQQKLDLRRQLLLHFWTVESHTHERDIPLLVDDEFRGDSGDLILFGEFFPRDFINQNRKGVFVIRYKFLRILDGGRQECEEICNG